MSKEEAKKNEPIEEKRKKSLFRYIAVMFVVAFALVLVSLLGQHKSLSLSSGVVQNAADLQEYNRELNDRVVALTEELAQVKSELDLYETLPLPENVQKAYEMLLAEDLDKLEEYKQYLGPEGLAMDENLMTEGNGND